MIATKTIVDGDREVTTGGIPMSAYNMRAAVAAQEALNAGKSMGEAVETARRIKLDEVVQIAADKAETKQLAPVDYSLRRRYCEAVANLAHGNFQKLTDSEIADVIRLVRHDVNSFEEWLENGK